MTRLRRIDGLTPELAEGLAPLIGEIEWPIVASDIESGAAELFEVNGDSYAVTRIEADINELVIVAYIGSGALEFAREMHKIAKHNEIASIRFLTQRPGLARLARRFGDVQADTVVRVTLQ